MVNCTVVGNVALKGGGVGVEHGSFGGVRNSVIWGNRNEDELPDSVYLDRWSGLSANHSNIEMEDPTEVWCVNGCINEDPQFVDPDNADIAQRDYSLQSDSPCIDAGDNCVIPCDDPELYQLVTDPDGFPGWEPSGNECGIGPEDNCPRIPVDLAGRARVMVGDVEERVDMGAFEFPACPACPADLSGSGTVGVPDLILLLSAWGTSGRDGADLTGNGSVGVPDLILLLGAWGPCPLCEESSGFGGEGGMESFDGTSHNVQECVDAFMIDDDLVALLDCIIAASGAQNE